MPLGRAGIWPEPWKMWSQLCRETGEDLLDSRFQNSCKEAAIWLEEVWGDFFGSDIWRENTLFYCLVIVHTYLRWKELIQKTLFTPTKWYFGLPAVPSREKSERTGTKAETSLALLGAGTGKETEEWVVRDELREQWVGRAT